MSPSASAPPRSPRRPRSRRGRRSRAPAQPVAGAPDDDGWDDDLGWEGVETAAPEARDAWERWRTTESPLAAQEPEPAPAEPEVELPSVERWRAKAQEEEDWLEDDDGLGWEGSGSEPALWNGNGHTPEPEHHGNGHVPAPETHTWTTGVNGRDWSRQDEASPAEPVAPALASASAATDVAPPPEAELGRTYELDDDGWDEPAGRPWGAPDEDPPAASPSPAPRGRRKVHPVVMLAIYAAVGIGLVVLASTALLGGSTDPAPADPPATRSTPEPVVTPEPTPEATGSAADDPAAVEAAKAAEREAQQAARRERTRALAARGAAVDRARAAERRRERARERRRENRSGSGSGSGARTPPPSNSSPQPTYTPSPRSNPAPAPRRSNPVCEFCIG